MMLQFAVFTLAGRRLLMVADTTRWDFSLGFNRIVKELPNG